MSRWKRIRDAFWFIPALCCAVAVLLSEAMISVDRAIDGADLGPLAGLVNRVGEAGSRDLLGAIASSTLAVAATSFSITIAVLATASSTYGPRLVRNFMADRGNQIVLGVFSATFLYSLLVLRSIRALGDTDAVFVPHLAVNLAVLLGVLSIGVLVYFINHIADSVQVWTLAGRVRSDLLDAVERLYPEGVGRDARELEDDAASAEIPGGLDADGASVASREIGYVQQVSEDRLLAAAQRHDALVVLRVRPGGHVAEGTTLATLWPPERVDDELADEVRACVLTGSARTPEQDIAFSVQVLEEMAVRALSPGTNDPYTAINALDELSAGFARLVGRSIPSRYRYDDRGRLRVIVERDEPAELLELVFDAMRTYAKQHPTVLRRTLLLAEQVGRASRSPELHAHLRRQVRLLLEAYERSEPQEHDLLRLRQRAAEVQESLAAPHSA